MITDNQIANVRAAKAAEHNHTAARVCDLALGAPERIEDQRFSHRLAFPDATAAEIDAMVAEAIAGARKACEEWAS